MERCNSAQDADKFVASCEADSEAMRAKLEAARQLLPKVTVNMDIKLKIRWGGRGRGCWHFALLCTAARQLLLPKVTVGMETKLKDQARRPGRRAAGCWRFGLPCLAWRGLAWGRHPARPIAMSQSVTLSIPQASRCRFRRVVVVLAWCPGTHCAAGGSAAFSQKGCVAAAAAGGGACCTKGCPALLEHSRVSHLPQRTLLPLSLPAAAAPTSPPLFHPTPIS